MFEEKIKEIRNQYNLLIDEKNTNEETTKNRIVEEVLKLLGYKKEWFYYERPTFNNNRFVDISIKINGDPNNLFFVEVKKAGKKLISKDITQLANYLNDKNIKWGLLTNGNYYILFNNKTNADSSQKDIMRYYLNTPLKQELNGYKYSAKRNKNNLKYLSYNYLFEKEATYYFKYLKDFMLTLNNDHSSRQYESLLYNYFDYLSVQKYKFSLKYIEPDTFKDYLIYNITNNSIRKPTRKETIISKYAYIKAFYETIICNQRDISNPFKKLTLEEMLRGITLQKNNTLNSDSLLNTDEIELILKSYNNNRSTIRNKLIFFLFLYTGLDVSEIKNLTLSDVDLNKNKLTINKRTIPIPTYLTNLIKEYLSLRKSKKIICEYLICGKYKKNYRYLDDSNFNTIISQQFNLINEIPEKRKKILKPKFIKASLIKRMYQAGINLETISYFIGISIPSVLDYLSNEDITKRVNFKTVFNKHPYKNFFMNK